MWHDPDDRIQRAVRRFEEDDVATARRMLRALERQGVESPRIELYLGHCHLEDGNPDAALRRYRRAAGLAPRRAEPWIGMGLAYGRLGRLRRARSAFARATRLDPDFEEAHCQLVHCHVLLGEMDAAARVARRVEVLDPRCPHVHRHMAVGFALAGRAAESLAAWRRVEARDADHPELHVGTGRALARLRRVEEARAQFLRALARDAQDAEARVGLGDLADGEGRAEEALEHYRAAVLADADDAEARVRLVETLLRGGRPDDALDALAPLRSSDEIDEADECMIASMEARALAALGRRGAGLALLRGVVSRRPADAEAWRTLGDFLLVVDRPRMAALALRRAVRTDHDGVEDGVESVRLLARALARLGQRKRAVSLLAEAARRHPTDEDLHVDVASALVARGRLESAERSLLRAASFLPESATLWAAAAELALERGRLGDARSRLRASLRRDRRHPQALSTLVRLLVAREDWRRAAHAARAAARVVAASDQAVRDHGLALLRLGRPSEALLPLRRYVLAAPHDSEAYRLLADAFDASGDRRGADAQRRVGAAVSRVPA